MQRRRRRKGHRRNGEAGRESQEKGLLISIAVSCVLTIIPVQLNDLQNNTGTPTLQVIRERLQHLEAVESIPSINSAEFARWADTRLDRWIIDWTLRHGKEKTAKKIAQDRGIEVREKLADERSPRLKLGRLWWT